MERKNTTSRMKIAAAVAAAALVILPNTSAEIAHAMEQIPVLGTLVNVVTFREYEVKTEDYTIAVEIPTVEMISDEFAGLEQDVNEEIYATCEQFAKESEADAMEYRDAFLETGGTLEEWEAHDIKIAVSYVVLLQSDEYLSLEIKRTESWNSAPAETKMLNLDLRTGEQISLEAVMEAAGETWYEDNDAVNSEAAAMYAMRIKEAVSGSDLEALADLMAYPTYVGLDGGIVIESREAMIALGAEQVFTEELAASVAAADVSDLTPSRAGFFMSAGDGMPNVIFGVVDGQLKITGINY